MMKKKHFVILAVLLLALAWTSTAQAQQAGLTIKLNRDFGYGGFSGEIQGTFSIKAEGPNDLVSVKFYIDGDLIGIDEEAPFGVQFHTGAFEPGMHVLSAVGVLSSGEELASNEITRQFLSGEQAQDLTLKLVVPLLVIVGGVTLAGMVIPLLFGRKDKARPVGEYGMAGGAVCPLCTLPYSRHVLSPNMVVGKLERCPHCGRWAIVRRAMPFELEAAEERLRADNQAGQHDEALSEEDRLRQMIEQSRFED